MSRSKTSLYLFFLLISFSIIMCREDQEESDFYSRSASKYLYAETENCNENNCPDPNWCSEDKKQCICIKGRANYPFSGDNGVYCTYKQHSQLACFLWELLLNLGIGHLIIKEYIIGCIKMVVMIIPCAITLFGLCGVLKTGFGHGTTANVSSALRIIFGVVAFAWWLTDASKNSFYFILLFNT